MVKGVATIVAVFGFTLFLVNRFVTLSPAARAQEVAPVPAPAPIAPQIGVRSGGPAEGLREVGITEQGRGVVSLPADRLRLTIRSFGAIPPRTPGAVGVAASLDDIEKDVVDTMRANGISDARALTPVLGNIGANDQFTGTIAKPTHDSVAAIEARILSKLPSAVLPLLRNVNVTGTLEADDCTAAIDRARKLAYADARERADALASAAGMHLGGLLAASESDQAGGCPGQSGAFPFYVNGGNESLEKSTVDVTVTLNATFMLRT